jgi:hypothetical protein
MLAVHGGHCTLPAMVSSYPTVERASRGRTVVDDRLGWLVLAAGLLITGAALFHLTRGTNFWFDEWQWIVGRRGWSAAAFLNDHNGHLSLVPVAIYKLLFVTAGLNHHAAYRLAAIAGHLACLVALFVYARPRVGVWVALLAVGVLALFGPGWQNMLWPFQVAWTLALACGIAALLMLDRRDGRGDVAACVLLGVAVACTSLGLAVAVGVIVELALVRRRWRDAWIAGVPLVLYAAWALAYQHPTLVGSVYKSVGFVAQSAAVTPSAVLGLSGLSITDLTGTLYTFGAPLAVLALVLLARLALRGAWTWRAMSVCAMLVAFWVLTALGRSDLGGPEASRYLYVDGVLAVLLAVELAAGRLISTRATLGLALLVAVSVISNLGVLRNAAEYLRNQGPPVVAEMTALNLSRQFVRPGEIATTFPGYPLIKLPIGQLYSAERQLGPIDEGLSGLAAAPADARSVADAQIAALRSVALSPAASGQPAGTPTPAWLSATAGSWSAGGSCVRFQATAEAPGVNSQIVVRVPGGGVWLHATGAQAAIGIRRFADSFTALGTLPAGQAARIRVPADAIGRPWQLQALSSGQVVICGLSGA